jgi:hypothetical protein
LLVCLFAAPGGRLCARVFVCGGRSAPVCLCVCLLGSWVLFEQTPLGDSTCAVAVCVCVRACVCVCVRVRVRMRACVCTLLDT